MKKNNQILLILCIAVFAVCAVLLGLVLKNRYDHARPLDKDPNDQMEQQTPEVKVPVDFAAWQKRNSDIYAWLEIPDTVIDYPILQRADDDSYYLRRDVDGEESVAGSLFTEASYNSLDFNDPVTVIYGHNMANDSMFGSLRGWVCDADWENTVYSFQIYQPDRILTYRIIGGVPYNDDHLLYWNNFSNEKVFDDFFQELYDRHSFYTYLLPDAMPHHGDRVVILSTCMGEHQRYLVIGVLQDDTAS